MERQGYIKLHRSITEWRWYRDANTFRVFVHLLLNARIAPGSVRDIVIERGEASTSYGAIAEELGLSVKEVRTAIDHLKKTGEISSRRFRSFQVIKIENYEKYQDGSLWAIKGQSMGNQRAVCGQSMGNQRAVCGQSKGNLRAIKEECKERKECNNIYISPLYPPLGGEEAEDGGFSTNSGANPSEVKQTFGVYGNVRLTADEYDGLRRDHSERLDEAIDFLDSYIEEDQERKVTYARRSCYVALKRWVFTAVEERRKRTFGQSGQYSGGQASTASGLDFSLDDVYERPTAEEA